MSEFEKELECENCDFRCTVTHSDEDATFVGMWFCPACGELIEDEHDDSRDEDFLGEEDDDYGIMDE